MNNTLIFLRHGKTKVTGEKPVSQWDLSDAGFAQAEAAKDIPEFQDVDVIIVSGEEKAYQTALPLARKLGKEAEIIREPQISELDRDKGGFLDHETYEKASHDTLTVRDTSVHDWETGNHALERFSKAIEGIDQKYEGKKILVVGHGMTFNLYFAKVLGELDGIAERFAGNTFCDWGIIKDGKVLKDLGALVSVNDRGATDMKIIYLVRHAESEGNAGLHFQGNHTQLTERGRSQAEFVADRCSRLKIDAIVTSPMVRAEETGKIISQKIGIPYGMSEHFSERRRPSSVVGKPMDDAEAKRVDTEWTVSLMKGGERVLDGENYDDISARAEKALEFLARHEAENILVVSHGFFMDMLLARAMFRDALTPALFSTVFNVFHTSNTGLSILRHGGKWAEWEVLTWNDHAHLG